MRDGALAPYELSLHASSPLALLADDGRALPLEVIRWLAPADSADRTVVARCAGPVLDVGCGPGRFVRALAERGIAALGVDIADTAVTLTRALGVPALLRSVFAQIPGEGRWPTILGANPRRLLERSRRLLGAGGRVFVETHPDVAADEVLTVRFTHDGTALGPVFGWAQVGVTALAAHATAAGCYVDEVWSDSGRSFACLLAERASRTIRTA